MIYQRVETEYWRDVLKVLVGQHVKHTASRYAQRMLDGWDREERHFWQVVPKEMLDKLEHPVTVDQEKETLSA